MLKDFKFSSITSRLSFWFFIVALLPLIIVGAVTYRIAERALIEQKFNELSKVADLKALQINDFMHERESYVNTLSHTPIVIHALKKFCAAFEDGMDSPAYRAADEKLRPILTYYQESAQNYDLFLISPEGDIVFAVTREADFGTNLYSGPYKDSQLAESFGVANTLFGTALSEFKYYPPSDAPAAFVAAPVFNNGDHVGVIALQMSTERIYGEVQDYTGLGETGETVVATKQGDRAVFVVPLRHDPDAAFKRSVLIGSPEALPIQRAVEGESGSGLSVDYRDKEILAVWRYLPHLRWGMVVKIDAEEAFASVFLLRNWTLIIGVITVFGVLLVAFLVARSTSKPIQALRAGTKIIGGGNLDHKVGTDERDEVGQLSRAFDRMCDNLKKITASRDELNREISGRKAAEEEKEKMQAQLFRAQKLEALGILAGGVAHNFNNLLTAVKGYAELSILQAGKKEPLFKYLKQILVAVDRTTDLIDKLLLFARRKPLALSTLNINSTVEDLLVMFHPLIGEDIKIKKELEPGLWTASADEGSIEQVIMNLVVNARDAMEGGGKLTLKTENVTLDEELSGDIPGSRPGRFVLLTVADTGGGIDTEHIEHIFEPFFTTKEVGKGTGLGLSFVYGIVKQHGGWLNVETEQAKGSSFKIYLPAVLEKTADKAARKVVPSKGPRGAGERILMVEDEEGVRRLNTSALTENGYKVFEAANAKEALDLFDRENGRFDLVLSDVVLPDIDGFKLVDTLLSLKPSLKVLLNSGYADEKLQWDVIRERGFGFLQKPYSVADLLKAIKDAIEEGNKKPPE